MSNSTNIPTFNDICGTVTEALAKTIINRNGIIAGLREDLRITQDLLRERCTNYNSLLNQNAGILAENLELKKTVAELEEEIELDSDISNTTERMTKGLRYALIVAENLKKDLDAQCKTLCTERDEARRQYCELIHQLEGTLPEKIADKNGWSYLYPFGSAAAASVNNTPNLFEQKSDSDPVTGVQYGDLN